MSNAKLITLGVYIIRNKINNKIYVGSAVNIEKRFYEHTWGLNNGRHRNMHLQRSWNKNGAAAFSFENILFCDKKSLIFFEQLVIDVLIERLGRKNIYNISLTAGSSLGRRHSEKTRRKIGAKSKGRWTGRHHTEETKKKISLGNLGKTKGRKHTAEAREKMSKSRIGRKFSTEHKRQLSESIKRSWVLRRKHVQE